MYDEIKKILVSSFHAPAEEVAPEATLADLGLDSLDLVELSMQLEAFGVRITDDELNNLQRVDAIANAVESRSAGVA